MFRSRHSRPIVPLRPVTIPLPQGRVAINEIPDHSISYTEYRHLNLNQRERHALVPKLSDAALIQLVEQDVLPNIAHDPIPVTYEQGLAAVYAPELVRRLRMR